MNSTTYRELNEHFRQLAEELNAIIEIDGSVPDGMVRLAGDRYVSMEEFQRMLRRQVREKKKK